MSEDARMERLEKRVAALEGLVREIAGKRGSGEVVKQAEIQPTVDPDVIAPRLPASPPPRFSPPNNGSANASSWPSA